MYANYASYLYQHVCIISYFNTIMYVLYLNHHNVGIIFNFITIMYVSYLATACICLMLRLMLKAASHSGVKHLGHV